MSETFTRRRVLAAGAGGVVVLGGAGAFIERGPLKRRYERLTGACGDAAEPVARSGSRVEAGTLPTRHLPAGRADYRIAYPPGFRKGDAPGVLVFLHGRGGQAADATARLRLQDHAVASRSPDAGDAGLAVVAVSGGDGYWHRRADGRDPLALLLDDFLPFCERRLGTKGGRVVMGVSMGGYGAALAARTAPGAFKGLVVSSGAFWTTRAEQRGSVPDAFDSDADYAGHDVIAAARSGAFAGLPIRVDCGTADPFEGANRAFARAAGARETRFDPGCHEDRTWQRYAGAQVVFARRVLLAA